VTAPGPTSTPTSFVSIVTPFHDTEDFLAECIESVLAQTHTNFEYILVENASSDRSLEIAESYAAHDDRIRLFETDRLLRQLENYNFALTHISADSEYCKIVQADDWVYPRCVAEMVALATANPSVGLLSALRRAGSAVDGGGIDPRIGVLTGAEAARAHLLGEMFVFGTQTTSMYRSDLVRKRAPSFFEPALSQADVDTAYDLLAESDFGFVHQVLSYSREEPGSIAGSRVRFNARDLDYLISVVRHADRFLDGADLARVRERARSKFYSAFAASWVRSALRGEAKEMTAHNREQLAAIGLRLEPRQIARGSVVAALRLLACPARLFGGVH
jgi:glycosyltransferase involved in cell wall biosynthesis